MMPVADRDHFMRNLWRWTSGLPEHELECVDIDNLAQTEWSLAFEQLMRTRLIQGSFRYGRLGAQFKPQWCRIQSMQRRLSDYALTGNLEHLVDVANLCLLEYVEGKHPKRHFHSIGEEQDHVHFIAAEAR